MKKLASAEWEGEMELNGRTVYVVAQYDITYIDPGYPQATVSMVEAFEDGGLPIHLELEDPHLYMWDRVECIIDDELKDITELCG